MPRSHEAASRSTNERFGACFETGFCEALLSMTPLVDSWSAHAEISRLAWRRRVVREARVARPDGEVGSRL
jgi:hypothetical protein